MGWDHRFGLKRLYFEGIDAQPGFFHGIFGRWSLNDGPYETAFNMGLNCGMPKEQVWLNRRRMLKSFGDAVQGVYAHQVHGSAVGEWNPSAEAVQGTRYVNGDALITAETGQGLVIQVADCQPVIMVDPVRRVVANVHSGWRGSVQNVIGATVGRMKAVFQCRPQDLICWVGPSLGPCCAEFVNYAHELPKAIWRYRRSHDLFDFWRLSRDQLNASGVRDVNIHVSSICTRCNQHLFNSYRGEPQTGRFAAVVGISR